jgi:hypothetical protein
MASQEVRIAAAVVVAVVLLQDLVQLAVRE